jgi:GDP-L-fucose synthase
MEDVDTKDMAKLCLDYFVNVETGRDVKIKDLKYVIKSIVGLYGEIHLE